MLEQLCMQEVSQIILSKPDGAVIPGKNYGVGEPIMIINNPALSSLSFFSFIILPPIQYNYYIKMTHSQ